MKAKKGQTKIDTRIHIDKEKDEWRKIDREIQIEKDRL